MIFLENDMWYKNERNCWSFLHTKNFKAIVFTFVRFNDKKFTCMIHNNNVLRANEFN